MIIFLINAAAFGYCLGRAEATNETTWVFLGLLNLLPLIIAIKPKKENK